VFWLVQKSALLQETPVLADGKVSLVFCFAFLFDFLRHADQYAANCCCYQHFFGLVSDAGAQVSAFARGRASFVVFDETGTRVLVLGRRHVQAQRRSKEAGIQISDWKGKSRAKRRCLKSHYFFSRVD
jgi:hypothetical protein